MRYLLGLASLLSTVFALHDSVIDVDSFTGFQVYRALPKDQSDASYLQTLRTLREHYDFWTEVRNSGPVDIMVPPGKQEQLESDLELKGISYEVMIPDVQKLIDLEKIAAPSQTPPNPKHAMTWDEYHTLEDMYTYLDYLEQTFDFVSTEVIGQSYEKRDIRVASICRGGCGEKKAVWIDGGMMLIIRILQRDLTGTSYSLPTLMVTPSPETITGCGERPGLTMGEFCTARVLMPTEIGGSTGMRAALQMTNVLTPTMDHPPFLNQRMWLLVNTSVLGKRTSSSTTPSIATAS